LLVCAWRYLGTPMPRLLLWGGAASIDATIIFRGAGQPLRGRGLFAAASRILHIAFLLPSVEIDLPEMLWRRPGERTWHPARTRLPTPAGQACLPLSLPSSHCHAMPLTCLFLQEGGREELYRSEARRRCAPRTRTDTRRRKRRDCTVTAPTAAPPFGTGGRRTPQRATQQTPFRSPNSRATPPLIDIAVALRRTP